MEENAYVIYWTDREKKPNTDYFVTPDTAIKVWGTLGLYYIHASSNPKDAVRVYLATLPLINVQVLQLDTSHLWPV
jgi:hypothetical protein